MSTPPEPARRRRADAERNRARLLAAADEVFTERSTAGSTEEIARRAEVAVGTVFRHFPTKEALIAAVFVERLRRLTGEARSLLAGDDPGAAFAEFFLRWTELTVHKQAFVEALRDAGVNVEAVVRDSKYPQVRAELIDAVNTLLARAQAAGAIRKDVLPDEVYALLLGATQAAGQLGDNGKAIRRVAGFVLDGLRAST